MSPTVCLPPRNAIVDLVKPRGAGGGGGGGGGNKRKGAGAASVVLVTHQLQYLSRPEVTRVVILKDGEKYQKGSWLGWLEDLRKGL